MATEPKDASSQGSAVASAQLFGWGARASIAGELSTPTQAPSGRCRASSPSPQPTSSTGVSPSASSRLATRAWMSSVRACSRNTERARRKRSGSRS
jgi:hypothetical protein